MRDTAATTGTPTEVGEESAEDLEVSGTESGAADPVHSGRDDDGAADLVGDGRQAVADAADAEDSASAAEDGPPDRPSFTRPPGMTPPPEHPQPGYPRTEESIRVPVGAAIGGPVTGTTATAPVSSPPGPTASPPSGGRAHQVDPAAAIGSARVNEAIRSTRAAAGPRGPRRARLSLKRLDPWSVMKFSFAVSLVLFIVMIVAASVLYLALDAMGVFASVNSTLSELIESGGGEGGETFRITASWVIGTAASLGAINVVLFTALATLGAFIYNVCADLVGGVEVTLAERD